MGTFVKRIVCLLPFLLAACVGISESVSSVTPPLKVAVYADRGPGGVGAVEWCRIVRDSPEMELKLVDAKGVCAGALEGQDLLVMPGGSSKREAESLGSNGLARVRTYIRNGGAYLGTCAGCGILFDVKGRGRVVPWSSRGYEDDLFFPNVKINAAGAKALGLAEGNRRMRYHAGPFPWPTTNVIEGAAFEAWGTVDSECTYRGSVDKKKQMCGSTAVIGGTYGKGRVFVTSMHPEYFETTHDIVRGAIRYLTGRSVTIPRPQRKRGDLAVGYVAGADLTVSAAEDALAVAALDGVDFQAINGDDILWSDRLEHVDVLAAPQGFPKKKSAVSRAVETFVVRGGIYLTCNGENVPKGAAVCRDRQEMIRRIRELVR